MSRYDDLLAEAIIMGTRIPSHDEKQNIGNGWSVAGHGFTIDGYVSLDGHDKLFGILAHPRVIGAEDRLVICQYLIHHFRFEDVTEERVKQLISRRKRNYLHRVFDLGYVRQMHWDIDRPWFSIPGTDVPLALFDVTFRDYSSFRLNDQRSAYLHIMKELFEIFTQRPA